MTTITTPSPTDLDHTPGTRLVFGAGALDRLGALAAELGGRRVMVVSDHGVTHAGHVDRAIQYITDAGLAGEAFINVHPNPTTLDVGAAVEAAHAFEPDLIVGLGGGSALDTAKGCNFIYTNGGAMADYRGIGKATRPMLPFIAVPTTHGTGSETQSFALIADQHTHMKMACGDPKALPKVALLDPALTRTQPPKVAACTSIDAITHAVESFVCTRRNEVSSRYAAESFALTSRALPRVLADGGDLAARGDMLLGAAYAGLAIENSMLGAAHSSANPMTAHFNVVHGQAVGAMLPHVIRFNAADQAVAALYDELAAAVGLSGVDELADGIASLVTAAGLETELSALGVDPALIRTMAEEAAAQWTANFNPRPIAADDFVALYAQAYGDES